MQMNLYMEKKVNFDRSLQHLTFRRKLLLKLKLNSKIRQRNMKYKKIINTNKVYSGVIFL